jgi:hypothetical protein
MTGLVFGRLRVIRRILSPDGKDLGAVWWLVRCEFEFGGCGTEKPMRGYVLRRGAESCGCKIGNWKHGAKSGRKITPEYAAWRGMIGRCRGYAEKDRSRYSERGILTCTGFKDFEFFIQELGLRPSMEHSIDRIDNDGHYSCGRCEECARAGRKLNVRWATRHEQAINTCKTRMLVCGGRKMCLSDWSRETGIPLTSIWIRLRNGWSVEEALTTRKGQNRKSNSEAVVG